MGGFLSTIYAHSEIDVPVPLFDTFNLRRDEHGSPKRDATFEKKRGLCNDIHHLLGTFQLLVLLPTCLRNKRRRRFETATVEQEMERRSASKERQGVA